MALGTPEGYTSYQAALNELMDFGWSIWTPAEMMALGFHARRARDRASDAHSVKQAVDGIRSRDGSRMVCGGSGLSRSGWKRANHTLERSGDLTQTRQTNRYGKYDSNEYTLNWASISAKIEQFKKSEGLKKRTRWVQPEPIMGSQRTHPPVHSEPIDMDRIRSVHPEPHLSQSQNQTLKVGHLAYACEMIRGAIYEATGEHVRQDRLIFAILDFGQDNGLAPKALVRFILWRVYDRRSAGYHVSPGLVLEMVRKESVGWARDNAEFVHRVQMEAEEETLQLQLEAPYRKPSSSEMIEATPKTRGQTA